MHSCPCGGGNLLWYSSKTPKLAASIPPDFPNLETLRLYTQPVTSQGDASFMAPPLVSNGGPNPVALTSFAKRHFVWGNPDGVLCYFASYIFPGLAIRELICRAVMLDQCAIHTPCQLTISEIIMYCCNKSSSYEKEAHVKLMVDDEYLVAICKAVSDTGEVDTHVRHKITHRMKKGRPETSSSESSKRSGAGLAAS